MSLYNKYRPKKISDMIGDFSFIEDELKKPDHNHVMLFDGPTGVGKDTLAYILADHLGATGFDFRCINASDATSVAAVRNIIEELDYMPHGEHKVYLLDECHMLSASAWSALRDPMENCPKHVYMIFATSSANKIPKDNRGRCFVVNFPKISEKDLYKLLKDVVKSEGLEIDNEVLVALSEVADGSARKALVDLESIASMEPSKHMDAVRKLGTDDIPEVIDLARQVYNGAPWQNIINTLKSLKEAGIEAETIRRTLLSYGSSMVLNNNMKGGVCKYFMEPTYDSGFPGVVVQCMKARGF